MVDPFGADPLQKAEPQGKLNHQNHINRTNKKIINGISSTGSGNFLGEGIPAEGMKRIPVNSVIGTNKMVKTRQLVPELFNLLGQQLKGKKFTENLTVSIFF